MVEIERLLRALAEVESSSGSNNYPRVEPAWLPKGQAFTIQGRIVTGTGAAWNPLVKKRWDRWNLPSACSFSSWQILYHTAADLGFLGDPRDLWKDEVAEPWVRRRLARIAKAGADEIREFADAWNSGNFQDGIVPEEYIAKVEAAYAALGEGSV